MNRAPVQVEAADVLPGLADAAAVAAVMRDVAAIIETCTADHGLTNASKFAGVFLAVAPEWADHRADVDPQTRAVNCMRDLACRLRGHSERAGMDIVINAGLASGPVTLGFAGQSRISFDATGSAVSLALAMVTSRVDGPLCPKKNSRETAAHCDGGLPVDLRHTLTISSRHLSLSPPPQRLSLSRARARVRCSTTARASSRPRTSPAPSTRASSGTSSTTSTSTA